MIPGTPYSTPRLGLPLFSVTQPAHDRAVHFEASRSEAHTLPGGVSYNERLPDKSLSTRTTSTMPGDDRIPAIGNITTEEDMEKVFEALRHNKGNEAQLLAPSLEHAASTGNVGLLNVLLVLGASPLTVCSFGESILHAVVAADNHDAARVLLKHRAPVDEPNEKGYTPLQVAAREGYPLTAAVLLVAGASTSYRFDRNSSTALELAARNGNMATIEVLLAHGADVNAATLGGVTSLHQAAMGNHTHVIRMLAEAGAETSTQSAADMWTPLHTSAYQNDGDSVKALCMLGASKNVLDVSGYTPLQNAIMTMSVDALRELLKAGADVELRHRGEETSALDLASSFGCVEMLGMLLDHGAEVTADDSAKRTALHKVGERGELRAVGLLLSKGANLEAKDVHGRTPLHDAAQRQSIGAVHALLMHGAKINASDNYGQLPLHLAARVSTDDRSAAVVELLLHWNANVATVDAAGQTAAGVLGNDAQPGVYPNDPPRNEAVLALLVTALAERRERAWRRRGFAVMWRARLIKASKELQKRKLTEGNVASGWACGVGTGKRMKLTRLEGGGGANGITGGRGMAAIVGMQEKGVFRNVIEFL